MWRQIMLVMLGGAVGSALRFSVSDWLQRSVGGDFPYGTVAVNLIGCTIIGVIGALTKTPLGADSSTFELTGEPLLSQSTRLILMVGLLGGFTTFSSFGLEMFYLIEKGQLAKAAVNLTVSAGLGLTMLWLAHRITEKCVQWIGS